MRMAIILVLAALLLAGCAQKAPEAGTAAGGDTLADADMQELNDLSAATDDLTQMNLGLNEAKDATEGIELNTKVAPAFEEVTA